MKDYAVMNILPGKFFSKPLYLDDNFIVATSEMAVSDTTIRALLDWGFPTLYSDGEPQEDYSPVDTTETGIESAVQSEIGDNEQLTKAKAVYLSLLRYVESLFAQIGGDIPPRFSEMVEKVKELCDIIRENRRYILWILKSPRKDTEQNYLIPHTAKSTILAIIIGSYLRLPNHRLIELGIAALLHEAGMLKLPPQIYLNKGALTPQEQKAILAHPILGYNVLKSFDLPLSVTIAALEHHERENGEGYPRHLTGDKISLYAKIIAVACSYEAQTSKRPHKAAKDGYEGMLDLLKNKGKQYDDTVIRALVFSLSIYPVGLYVLLSNDKKGQVVDVNPENPRYPIVQVLGDLNPNGENKVLETSENGIHIVRPLFREEIE
jgi:HD-GYP domain-containing protein (c-di-GMP phosphodiesterase class II)